MQIFFKIRSRYGYQMVLLIPEVTIWLVRLLLNASAESLEIWQAELFRHGKLTRKISSKFGHAMAVKWYF